MWIKLSQLTFLSFLLYHNFYKNTISSVSNMLLVLGIAMIMFIMFAIITKSISIEKGITAEVLLWLLFASISYITGIFVAVDPHHLVNSLLTFLQTLTLVVGMIFISSYNKSMNFLTVAYVVAAVLVSFWVVTFGTQIFTGRITLSDNTNPNFVGTILFIAMFCLTFHFDMKNKWRSLVIFLGLMFFLYIIILTGSRKSLIAAAFYLIYWIVTIYPRTLKLATFSAKFVLSILIPLVFIIFLINYGPIFLESETFTRINSLITVGDETRSMMFKDGLGLFAQNPWFGVGFKQYMLVGMFSTYSHSTYSELLACTGIIGTVLYLSAYMTMLRKTIYILKDKKINNEVKNQARCVLGLWGGLIFTGIGTIHFYDINSMIALALIISFNKLYYKDDTQKS